MKATALAMALATFALLLAATPAAAERTFSLEGGYRLTIPDGYSPDGSVKRGVGFTSESDLTAVRIATERNKHPEIKAELLGRAIQDEIEKSGKSVKYGGVEKIGGNDAYVIYGKDEKDGSGTSFFVYVLPFRDYMHTMTCVCPAENEDADAETFDNMAGSIGKEQPRKEGSK